MGNARPRIIQATAEETRELLAGDCRGFQRLGLMGPSVPSVTYYNSLHDFWKSQLDCLDLIVVLPNAELSMLPILESVESLQALAIWDIALGTQSTLFGRFSELEFLSLHNTTIGDEGVHALSVLNNLTMLDLAHNNISERGATVLSTLANLTILNLNKNNIGDEGAHELSVLDNLTTLDLGYNNISDLGATALSGLANLTTLNLSVNNIGANGAKALSIMSTLTTLHLNGSGIGSDGAESLSGLNNLTTLHLHDNHIVDKGAKALSQLGSLTSLDLNRNHIGTKGAQALAGLAKLTTLKLYNNKIGDEGAKALEGLGNLTTLDLKYNEIGAEGAKALAGLGNLTTLNLDSNRIGTKGARALSALENLTTLHLNNNKIGSEGAKALSVLVKLTTLHLSNNEIIDSALPYLSNLTQLEHLSLGQNPLTDLSPLKELIQNGLEITISRTRGGLNVYECPINRPPPEIVEQGHKAVLIYFDELEVQGTDQLFEAKMLVVGEGGVGKTSLIRRLYHPELALPKEEDTTRGIVIEPIGFALNNSRQFHLNIWDFGGQHIYHATHQFFLTKRSLYVLVDSSRTNDKAVQDEVYKYWLEVIETLSDASPVLIFQNQVGGRSKAIDQPGIKKRYTNVMQFFEGDLAQPYGADEIKAGIEYYAQRLPHIGDAVPAKWVSIRKEIENLTLQRPFIYRREFFDIYSQHLEFDREKALKLSRYYHDLGVFLHFQDEIQLAGLVILQNEWATEAVFKVLDDEIIKARSGRFTQADCQRIWSESNYEDMHAQLLALMNRFELCFELADCQQKTWLATQLLPASVPDPLTNWPAVGDICLLYRYDFLPRGIVNRLMVRMNRFIKQLDFAWCYGAFFEKGETQLLVQETADGNEISLHCRGPEAKALLNVIAHDLDAINHSFEGLRNKVQKLIPCICEECKQSNTPHFFEENHLLRKKEKNSFKIECKQSFLDVDVLELLEGLKLDLPTWENEKENRSSNKAQHDEEEFEPADNVVANQEKVFQIFLASSQELAYERDAFDLFVRRENDRLRKQGVYLEVIRWEHHLDAISANGLQEEYNKAVKSCDIFVSLFKTKTGKFTEEEFDTAHKNFKELGKPIIYTYFQVAHISTADVNMQDLNSLSAFKEKLKDLKHYHTDYENLQDLKLKFKEQIQMLIDQ